MPIGDVQLQGITIVSPIKATLQGLDYRRNILKGVTIAVGTGASIMQLKVVDRNHEPIEGATCRVLNAELGLGSTKDVKATDGVDDYINFGDVLDLGLDSWTYELWFKKTKSGTNQGIIGKYSTAAVAGSWSLVEETTLLLLLKSPSNIIISVPTPLTLNTWVHLACVFDRTGNMILYVNGVAAGSDSIASLSGTNFNNANNFCIGRLATTFSGYWAGGRYSDLRIWKKVLTPEEILASMNSRLNGNEADLEAYLPMMETSGSTVEDIVGSYDGTVFGATSVNDQDLPIPEVDGAIDGYDTTTPYDSQTTNVNGLTTLNYQINTIHGLEVTLPGKRRFIMPFKRTERGLLDWQVMLSDYLATFATDRGNILINSEPENNDANFLIE